MRVDVSKDVSHVFVRRGVDFVCTVANVDAVEPLLKKLLAGGLTYRSAPLFSNGSSAGTRVIVPMKQFSSGHPPEVLKAKKENGETPSDKRSREATRMSSSKKST